MLLQCWHILCPWSNDKPTLGQLVQHLLIVAVLSILKSSVLSSVTVDIVICSNVIVYQNIMFLHHDSERAKIKKPRDIYK